MGIEGFSSFRKAVAKEGIPAGTPDAAEVASVYNELQIEMAKRQHRSDHPDELRTASGNEIMEAWITGGSAAKFAEEFGEYDAEGLRGVLKRLREQDSETLH